MKEPALFSKPQPPPTFVRDRLVPIVSKQKESLPRVPIGSKTQGLPQVNFQTKNTAQRLPDRSEVPKEETIHIGVCSNPDVFGPVLWTSFETFCRVYRNYYQIHAQKAKQESHCKPDKPTKEKKTSSNSLVCPNSLSSFASDPLRSQSQKPNPECSIVRERKWQNVIKQPNIKQFPLHSDKSNSTKRRFATLETNHELKKFLLTHTTPFRKWFENSILAIPCPTCRTHALEHLSKHPFKFETPQSLERSLLDLYNSVQKKLKLPEWSMKQWKLKCKIHWNAQKVDFYFFVSKHSPFYFDPQMTSKTDAVETKSLEERREGNGVKSRSSESFVDTVSKKDLYEEFLLHRKNNPSYRPFVCWKKREKKALIGQNNVNVASPTDENTTRQAKRNLEWALDVPGWVRLLWIEHAWLVVGQYPQNPNLADQVLMREWLEVTLKFGFLRPSLEKEKTHLLQRLDYSKKAAVSSALLEFYNLYSKFDLSFSLESHKTTSRQNMENFERARASCFYILFDDQTLKIPPSHISPVFPSSSSSSSSPLSVTLPFFLPNPQEVSQVQEEKSKEAAPDNSKEKENLSLNFHQDEKKNSVEKSEATNLSIQFDLQTNERKEEEKEREKEKEKEKETLQKKPQRTEMQVPYASTCFQNASTATAMASCDLLQKFIIVLFCLLFLLFFMKLLS